jgi:hypothetical protein
MDEQAVLKSVCNRIEMVHPRVLRGAAAGKPTRADE